VTGNKFYTVNPKVIGATVKKKNCCQGDLAPENFVRPCPKLFAPWDRMNLQGNYSEEILGTEGRVDSYSVWCVILQLYSRLSIFRSRLLDKLFCRKFLQVSKNSVIIFWDTAPVIS
jgi:hypothetical protein